MRTTYKYDAKTGLMVPSAPEPAGTCNMLMVSQLAGFGAKTGGGGGGGGGEPDLTNLTAWWRADDVVLDGSSNVETINDKSGNGRNISVSPGNRPSIGSIGGQDALDFDGTEFVETGFNNGTLISVSLGTVFVILNVRTFNANTNSSARESTVFAFDNRFAGITNSGGGLRAYNYDGSYQITGSDTLTDGQDYGAIWTLDSAGDGVSLKVTGFAERSATCGNTSSNTEPLVLADHTSGGSTNDTLDGLIAEILVYSDDHSDNQKTRDYLAARYGLTW